jgi:hypothetical protein
MHHGEFKYAGAYSVIMVMISSSTLNEKIGILSHGPQGCIHSQLEEKVQKLQIISLLRERRELCSKPGGGPWAVETYIESKDQVMCLCKAGFNLP